MTTALGTHELAEIEVRETTELSSQVALIIAQPTLKSYVGSPSVFAGTKNIEYRRIKPYWTKLLSEAGR